MRRLVILVLLMVLALLLQGCGGVYHRHSTGNNVSLPVAPPNPAEQI